MINFHNFSLWKTYEYERPTGLGQVLCRFIYQKLQIHLRSWLIEFSVMREIIVNIVGVIGTYHQSF